MYCGTGRTGKPRRGRGSHGEDRGCVVERVGSRWAADLEIRSEVMVGGIKMKPRTRESRWAVCWLNRKGVSCVAVSLARDNSRDSVILSALPQAADER